MKGKCYLFFDEIQELDGWQEACKTLRLYDNSIFITGSNSKLLSGEFTKELSGRFVSFRIRPFVYKEILSARARLGSHLGQRHPSAGRTSRTADRRCAHRGEKACSRTRHSPSSDRTDGRRIYRSVCSPARKRRRQNSLPSFRHRRERLDRVIRRQPSSASRRIRLYP